MNTIVKILIKLITNVKNKLNQFGLVKLKPSFKPVIKRFDLNLFNLGLRAWGNNNKEYNFSQ